MQILLVIGKQLPNVYVVLPKLHARPVSARGSIMQLQQEYRSTGINIGMAIISQ
jgi:hypothetical protein